MKKVNPQVDHPVSEFAGSSLQHEMESNPEFVKAVWHWTELAHILNPESEFWKEAWVFIQKQNEKHKLKDKINNENRN